MPNEFLVRQLPMQSDCCCFFNFYFDFRVAVIFVALWAWGAGGGKRERAKQFEERERCTWKEEYMKDTHTHTNKTGLGRHFRSQKVQSAMSSAACELSITIDWLSQAALAGNACRANNNENDRFSETMISIQRKKEREREVERVRKCENAWEREGGGRQREREGRRRRGTHTFLKHAQTKEFNKVRERERNR